MFDDAFHTSLFALCMEIVLFSFNSIRRFPWILDTFNLAGYHFFKVIEIVVRTEENLSRDVVKHLSQVIQQHKHNVLKTV
jgi:retinoblastoma-like protein 1